MYRSRGNNNRRRTAKRAVRQKSSLNLGTQIQTQNVLHMDFMFRANATLSNVQIYVRDFYSLLWMATSGISANGLITSFKITKVNVLAIATGGAGQELNTVALSYTGFIGKSVEYLSQGSVAMPARILSKPPKGTLSSFWMSLAPTGSTNYGESLFILSSLTRGVMVEVGLSFILGDGSQFPTFNLTTLGASTGTVYTNYLDSCTSAGGMAPASTLPAIGRGTLQAWG